ncbi:MAG: hypothetical protein QXN55_02080 [Candidatus Nitrosotenuis sp.]|jgi:hypothetical protein
MLEKRVQKSEVKEDAFIKEVDQYMSENPRLFKAFAEEKFD